MRTDFTPLPTSKNEEKLSAEARLRFHPLKPQQVKLEGLGPQLSTQLSVNKTPKNTWVPENIVPMSRKRE